MKTIKKTRCSLNELIGYRKKYNSVTRNGHTFTGNPYSKEKLIIEPKEKPATKKETKKQTPRNKAKTYSNRRTGSFFTS